MSQRDQLQLPLRPPGCYWPPPRRTLGQRPAVAGHAFGRALRWDVGRDSDDVVTLLQRTRSLGGFVWRKMKDDSGPHRGLLIPDQHDSFRILVALEYMRSQFGNGAALWDEVRFTVAHEIGHSFFYLRRHGERPQRLRPFDPEEATFCDAFAGGLLGLPRPG